MNIDFSTILAAVIIRDGNAVNAINSLPITHPRSRKENAEEETATELVKEAKEFYEEACRQMGTVLDSYCKECNNNCSEVFCSQKCADNYRATLSIKNHVRK